MFRVLQWFSFGSIWFGFNSLCECTQAQRMRQANAPTMNNLHLWSSPNTRIHTLGTPWPFYYQTMDFRWENLLFLYITDYNEDRLIYDEERKYGKIPAKIYLLYLKSCGLWTIGVFCLSALAWQATKIYLDIWLRDWTDIEQTNRFADVRTHRQTDASTEHAHTHTHIHNLL